MQSTLRCVCYDLGKQDAVYNKAGANWDPVFAGMREKMYLVRVNNWPKHPKLTHANSEGHTRKQIF